MEDYDEETAVKVAMQESLESQRKGVGRGMTGIDPHHGSSSMSSSISSIKTNSTATTSRSSVNKRIARTGTGAVKTRGMGDSSGGTSKPQTRKIGGNHGQTLIDPWLSADAAVLESELESELETQCFVERGPRSGSHPHRLPQDTAGYLRRTSVGRSRADHEPMTLMSTSASSPGLLREETPGLRFASPRKRTVEPVEVIGSDEEEVELDDSQVQGRDTLVADQPIGDNKSEKVVASPAPASHRKRLMRVSSSAPSINVISSNDEESDHQEAFSPRGRRSLPRVILESSDDDLDELSRDAGKSVQKTSTIRSRNFRHPVAEDTIPWPSNISTTPGASAAATVASGSSARMPWTITEGPDKDIVLSTPTSKQRVRHYNMVLDSEDELSEAEKSSNLWSVDRRRCSAHTRHMGLPQVEAVGGEAGKRIPLQTLVSDSETEAGPSEMAAMGQEDIFTITQPSVDERDEGGEKIYVVESQDAHGLQGRNWSSLTRETHRSEPITKLSKPMPLVLDLLSDEDFSQGALGSSKPKYQKEVEDDHRKLRDTLMFTDGPEEISPSPTPDRNFRIKMDQRREQLKFDKSPFSNFPIFDRVAKPPKEEDLKGEPKEDDRQIYPLWKKRSLETEGKRSREQISSAAQEDDEEEEEALEDPRARRRSGRANLASPPKKMKLSDIAPDVAVMESALAAAAAHVRQQAEAKKPYPLERMETIESFSTQSDSQPVAIRAHPHIGRCITQTEEIEDFSDDQKSQMAQMGPRHQPMERKIRRYSGLHLVGRDQPSTPSNSIRVDGALDQELDRPPETELYQEQGSQNLGGISPTLSPTAMEKCPICRTMIPAGELMEHVDAELLANEQQEKEDMRKRDEAMAFALDESFQTQDVVIINDSFTENEFLTQVPSRLQPPTVGAKPTFDGRNPLAFPRTPVRPRDGRVSLDTPTRKVGRLTLESPPSASKFDDNESDTSGLANLSNEALYGHDSIAVNDLGSQSSQSAFAIQSGQVLHDPESSETYISLRQPLSSCSSRKKTIPKPRNVVGKKAESGGMSAPFLIHDGLVDNGEDDLDDFFDMPEPASMINRSFRTAGKATGKATSSSRTSTRRKSLAKAASPVKKKPNTATVDLDDSEDEKDDVVTPSIRTTVTKKGSKSRPSFLDDLLPMPARQRRQQQLRKGRGQLIDDDDEIEVGRHRPVAEKLWNQEDDLFDSEHLDRRQVKGVGLGGVVGGIGAIPGSLATSKTTKVTATAAAAISSSAHESAPPLGSFGEPPFELEDPNYGLQSQDWWEHEELDNSGRSWERGDRSGPDTSFADNSHQVEAAGQGQDEDDGYMSPLDDFVDLRKRRDDPEMAMYFAQFGADITTENDGTARAKSTRGRGRGRSSRGSGTGKKGVSLGRGVGPMSTTMGVNGSASASRTTGGQAVLTTYGIPGRLQPTVSNAASLDHAGGHDRYGARNVSFGDHATTANGSMAIRSKPTQPYTPAKGRGRGGGKSKSAWRGRWAGRRGRGRG